MIINKELTPLEALKHLESIVEIEMDEINYKEDISIIENALKALEIIKEKDVDVGWLKRSKDLHEYNNGMGINSYSALTQEEYDLLKEVLL